MRRRDGGHRLQWRSRQTQGEDTMSNNKKPTHRAFIVKTFTDKDGTEKNRWIDIGGVWTHRDGKGFDVSLEAMPLDGRIVIRLDEPKSATPTA
jgi:hypothetical protein